jgi:hypothetical protein
VFAGRCRSAAIGKDDAGAGALDSVGVEITMHDETPQGPSQIPPITAQPAKAMASGAKRTHTANTRMTIVPRELIRISLTLLKTLEPR